MNPTSETVRGARKPAVALGKIGTDNTPLEIKVRLVGDQVAAFRDYQRAYQAAHGETVDPGVLASHMLSAFIEADRGFAMWRKTNPDAGG